MINRTNGAGIPLYLLGKKQFGHNLNWVVRVPQEARAELRNQPLSSAIVEDDQASQAIPATHYISMMDPLTNASGIVITDDEGYLLSGDRTHVTRHGAIYLGRQVLKNTPISNLLPLKR